MVDQNSASWNQIERWLRNLRTADHCLTWAAAFCHSLGSLGAPFHNPEYSTLQSGFPTDCCRLVRGLDWSRLDV